jgi:hypothetical protein
MRLEKSFTHLKILNGLQANCPVLNRDFDKNDERKISPISLRLHPNTYIVLTDLHPFLIPCRQYENIYHHVSQQ